jgi:hypothetical protein
MKLDGRTKESRLLEDVRRDLVRHVGNKPSATQRQLIERACQLTLRVALMDQAFAETGEMSDHTSRVYLAWSNSLSRTLRELGLKGAAERTPSLADYLRSPDAKRRRLPPVQQS